MPQAARASRRLRLEIRLICALLLVVVWLGAAYLMHRDQTRTEAEVVRQVVGASQAYEAYLHGQIAQIDLLLQMVAVQDSPAAVRLNLEQLQRRGDSTNIAVQSLYLTDAEGRVVSSSLQTPLAESATNAADRAYFLMHRRGEVQGLYIGAPTVGRHSGKQRIHFSRARRDSSGKFDGVVVAAVDPAELTRTYSVAQLGLRGGLGLVSARDWIIRVWRTGDEFLYGVQIQHSLLAQSVRSASQGSYRTAASALDGRDRFVGYKLHAPSGLVAVTSLDADEALAPFYARAKGVLAGAVVSSVLLLLAFAPVRTAARHLETSRREQARAVELFNAASNAQLDGFLIFEAVRGGMGEISDFHCVHANKQASEWLHPAGLEMKSFSLTNAVQGVEFDAWFVEFCHVVSTRTASVADIDLRVRSGTAMRATRHVLPVLDGVAVNLRDITSEYLHGQQLAQSHEAVERSERLLRGLTDSVPVLLAHFDRNFVVTFMNGKTADWLGEQWRHPVGKHMRDLWGDQMYAERLPHLMLAISGKTAEFLSERQTPHGVRAFNNTYVPDVGPNGEVEGIYAVCSDVTNLKRTEEQLITLATTDSLTGLRNRRFFTERLPEVLSRAMRQRTGVGLLYIDVDRFKSINDSLGHATGDVVLKEVASRLKSSVRAHDLVARLSGDEFVVLLEDVTELGQVQQVGDKIRASAQLPVQLEEGRSVLATLSIGGTFECPVNSSPEALLANADKALYKVKAHGRNDVFASDGPVVEQLLGSNLLPFRPRGL